MGENGREIRDSPGSGTSGALPSLFPALFLVVLIGLLVAGCSAPEAPPTPALPAPSAAVQNVTGVEIHSLPLPDNRSFSMGFTPFPYDWPDEAQEETYRFITLHGDLVAHHLDDGVPWPEAYAGTLYHPDVERNLAVRAAHVGKNQQVYLAFTPLSTLRDSPAGYWGARSNLELPPGWKGRGFDDPVVLAAYLNYSRRMIDTFQPDWVAYGIEVNILAEKDPAGFEKFVPLSAEVYRTLKREYPDLPLFLTFQLDTFHRDPVAQERAIRRLLPYTDYLAVSSYPFRPFGKFENPDEIPGDYFQALRSLAPEKPYAVAETGYIAEDLTLGGSFRPSARGTPCWQAVYARRLLSDAQAGKARFVVWFVSRDYDRLWVVLDQMGVPPWVKGWRDTGLADGDGNPREALAVWDAWLSVKRTP